MRHVTILCAVLGLALAGARPARACSCVPPPPPLEALEQAEAVFAGTAVAIRLEEGAFGNEYVVRFQVDHRFKGPEHGEITIRTADNSAACGYYFREGKEYLIYAHRGDDGLRVSLCSRTARLVDAKEDLKALGAEDLTGSDLVGTSGGMCGGPSNMAALQAIAFVVLGTFVTRRHRRRDDADLEKL